VSIVAPQHTPKLLTTPERKAELIASLGVQELVVIPFDAEFAKRSADEFMSDVLVGALGAKRVAIGENFRFGHKAQGDPRLLSTDERFATTVHPLLEVDGEIVSSSHIRGLVLAGELAEATRLLGAPFSTVRRGHPRRRARSRAWLSDRQPGARRGAGPAPVTGCTRVLPTGTPPPSASVCARPFRTGRGELIEAYLLDFDGDLYGRTLCLEFLARLRGERRFDSPGALVAQMHLDVVQTRELVDEHRARA